MVISSHDLLWCWVVFKTPPNFESKRLSCQQHQNQIILVGIEIRIIVNSTLNLAIQGEIAIMIMDPIRIPNRN